MHLQHNKAFRSKTKHIKGKVIDLGCGLSPYKKDVLELGAHYIGVDWSNSLHHVVPDVVADLTKTLPFEDNSADTLLSFQVLEHLPTPQSFLSECCRILKKEGCLFLTVPFQWRVHEAPYDYFRYTRYGLNHLLSEAGFKNISIEETGGFWTTWILKWNYFITTKFSLGKLNYLLSPFWFINQVIAILFERIVTNKQEATGYLVIASK